MENRLEGQANMKKLELKRKKLLTQYQSINLLSLGLFLAFLGIGVYQFFFKTEAYWPLILMGIFALGLFFSSWQSQRQLKAFKRFWQGSYLPQILSNISKDAQYLDAKSFDPHKIPGLYSKESDLELVEAEHYIQLFLKEGINADFIRLKILEWQGKRRKKSSVRFEGLFLRIEGLADAKALAEQKELLRAAENLGETWGAAKLSASSDNALILYLLTDKKFWSSQPNEQLHKSNLVKELDAAFRPIYDFSMQIISTV
jgi:hypothetical protein